MTTIQRTPKITRRTWTSHLRLVWALAAKDIIDAVKTKVTLTTIIISLLMVLFYRYFPLLTAEDTLRVFMYAETESELSVALERSPVLALYQVDERERLLDVFAGAEAVELAVELPESAVAQQRAGGPVTLDGYMMYWVDPAQRAEIKQLVEEDLSAELGLPVTLELTGHDVYFDADQFFFVFSSTIALLFVTVIIGVSIVPNLMIEEKQAKTLDALRVSPASAAHLVAGKAIAGLFYGMLGCAMVLVVFRYLIVQWALAILAAGISTLFMVAIGLLLGMFVNARAQLQLVAWFVILPLLMPVILVALEGLVPSGAVAVMNWIPTVLLAKLFRLSLTPNAAIAHYGLDLTVIVASTLVLLALVVGLVRRQDRG